MRGKKVDNDFLSQFISDCAENNKCSSDEILFEAKQKIEFIDNKIKEVEKLKIIRSKLLDVVNIFNDKNNIKKENDENLYFFEFKNQHICKFICDSLKGSNLIIDSIKSNIYATEDILFCIKQLLEHKIIYRSGNCLIKGSKFEVYYKTIIRN